MIKQFACATAISLVIFSSASADLLDKIAAGEPVKIGFTNIAPWAYIDTSGALVGQEPEILEAVLQRMGGGQIEGTVVDFSALINGVKSRRIDIASAGIFIRPDRCQEVRFSEPLSQVPLAFIVQKGNPLNLNAYEDFLANEEATLAATIGTTEALLATQAGIPGDQVLLFDRTSDAILSVKVGRADAAAELWIGAKYAEANWPEGYDLEVAAPIYEVNGQPVSGHTAFVVHPEEKNFLDALNAELVAFIGSPEHAAITEKYGFTSSMLPSATTQDLCSP